MLVEIYRQKFDKDDPERGILGKLYINGVYVCDTLEPPYRDKYGCVDAGTYSVVEKYSPSFRRKMFYLDMAKAGSRRTGIMFHTGNSAYNPQDTKGCILVGYVTIPDSFYISYSRAAFQVFMWNLNSCHNVSDIKVDIHDCFEFV